jgi:hypothetical protein
MDVVDLADQPDRLQLQAAAFLVHHFDEPRGWPTLAAARDEVGHVLGEGFARAAIDGEALLGWIGGLPQYHGRVWESRPMVAPRALAGIGRALVAAFEAEAAAAARSPSRSARTTTRK